MSNTTVAIPAAVKTARELISDEVELFNASGKPKKLFSHRKQ